MKWFRRND